MNFVNYNFDIACSGIAKFMIFKGICFTKFSKFPISYIRKILKSTAYI